MLMSIEDYILSQSGGWAYNLVLGQGSTLKLALVTCAPHSMFPYGENGLQMTFKSMELAASHCTFFFVLLFNVRKVTNFLL